MNEDNFLKEVVLDIIREMIEKGELRLSIDILPDYECVEYGFGGEEKYSYFKILTHLTSGASLLGYWENKFNSSILKDILLGKGDVIMGKNEIDCCLNSLDRRICNEISKEEANKYFIFDELNRLKEEVKYLREQLKIENKDE